MAGGSPARGQGDEAVARTAQGLPRGRSDNGIHSFKGIAYAASPTGDARFQPPRPPSAWDGVHDALAFGPKPPQADYPPIVASLIPPELTPAGDDCLTLNVWTPELDSGRSP
jgi:carboxylesterase type B